MTDTVLVTRHRLDSLAGGDADDRQVATVTLNRPAVRNALLPSMVRAARRAIDALVGDPTVRCLVLTGAGEGASAAFCAGADLRSAILEDPEMLDKLELYLDDFHGLVRAIWQADKPVVARVDGGAVGFGCDLALACDLRVLSTQGYLQSSFTRIGLVPDGGGTGTLARLVGLGVATQMIFLAEKITADRALALGLATRVVAPAELDGATTAMAVELAKGPPLAFAAAKRALHASLGMSIDEVLGRERDAQLRCLRSADAMEGVMAWAQKRPPRFTGK